MSLSCTAITRIPADVAPFFLGRQPILDRRGNTVAYELLFRSDPSGGAHVTDGRQATASVIAHAFSELGIEAVLGNCRGFINFDTDTLLSDLPEALPADKIVLEILETVEFNEAVINRCRELHAAGFRMALDDVTALSSGHEQVLPIVDVIKLDLMDIPHEQLPAIAEACQRPGIELLAEKVDTREQAEYCHALGFNYFQGYYFARPIVLEGRTVDPSRSVLLKLLQQLMAEAEIQEIESTFKQSPELSYKLMRLVNSAADRPEQSDRESVARADRAR